MPVIRERQTFTEDGKKKDTLQGRVNNKQILVNDGDKTGNSTDTYMSKPLPKNATESKKSIGSKVVDFIKSKNEEPKTNLLSWIDNSKRTGAKAYDLLQSISDYGQKISDNDDYVDMMRLKNAKQKKEEKEKKKLTDPYYNLPSYVSKEDAKQYRIDNTNKALDKMESDANKNGDLTMADVVYNNNGNFELVNYQKDIQNLDKTLKDYQKQLQQIATESNPYGFDYNGVMQQDYANKTQEIQSLYNETKKDYDELVRRKKYQDAIVGRWALEYAIANDDDVGIHDIYKDYASYDDDPVSRRLKNLGNVPLEIASSIATVSDVVRDLAGEERARQIEEKATKMLHDGKITDDEFNDLLSKAKDFSDFDATNKDLLSSQLREISNQIAHEVSYGEDGIGKFIGQGLDSTVNFVARFFLLGPQGSLLSMATQSGSQKYFENLEKGYSKDIAFLNALATGAISYYVEKMNVDNFVAILNGTVGQSVFAQALNAMAQGKGNLGVWGRNIMSQGLSEFAEEGIEGNLDYGLDWLTAKMFNGEPVEYNPGDIFYNMLIGGFSGLLTGATGNSYNIVVNTRAQYNSLRNDVNSLIQIRNEAVMKGEDVTSINKAIQTGELALNSFEEKSQTMAVTLPGDLVDDNLTPQGVKQELTDVLRPQVDQAVQQTLNQEEVVNRIYDMSQQFLTYKGINAPVQEFTNMPAQQRQAVMLASEFFKSNNIKNAFTRLISGQNGLIVKDGILINTDQSKTIDIDALADLDEDTYGKIDKATNAIFEKENAGADPSATTSVAHEVSHYAEKSGLWENLRNTVRDMMGSERFEIAKTRINDIYSARNVKNADAETEVVAFFIQKNLGNTEFLQRLSSYNNSLLSRLYSDVKAMFSGDEKVKLENIFEKVFRDAQNRQSEQLQNQSYLRNDLSLDGNKQSRINLDSVIDKIIEGKKPEGNQLLYNRTPQILKDVGAEDLQFIISPNEMMKAVLSIDEARALGYNVEKAKTFHALGKTGFNKVIDGMSDPVFILKKGNKLVEFIEYFDKDGSQVIVPIEINTESQLDNRRGKYNVMLSAHGKIAIKNFITNRLNDGWNVVYQDNKKIQNVLDSGRVQYPDSIISVFNNNISNNNDKVKQYSLGQTNDAQLHKDRAIEEYGVTNDPMLAGYLMDDGQYLDFSEGQGYRVQDHRNVGYVFDDIDYGRDGMSAGMVRFMNEGNIRIMPESPGIDISNVNEPTTQQYDSLYDYFNIATEEGIKVDFSDEEGRSVFAIDYPPMTSPRRIINDIKQYFEDGTIPEVNNPSNYFRYSFGEKNIDDAKDNDGEKVPKDLAEYLKGSKLTDSNGDILRIYHTSPKLFTEFNPVGSDFYRFGDKVVNYYSSNPVVSGSYTEDDYNQISTANDIKDTEESATRLKEIDTELRELSKVRSELIDDFDGTIFLAVQESDLSDALIDTLDNIRTFKIPNDFPLWHGRGSGANYDLIHYLSNMVRRVVNAHDGTMATNAIWEITKMLDENKYNQNTVAKEVRDLFNPLEKVKSRLYELSEEGKAFKEKISEYTIKENDLRSERDRNKKALAGKQYVGYGKSLNPYVIEGNDFTNWNTINSGKYTIDENQYVNLAREVVDVFDRVRDMLQLEEVTKTKNRINRVILQNVSEETRQFLIDNPIVLANFTVMVQDSAKSMLHSAMGSMNSFIKGLQDKANNALRERLTTDLEGREYVFDNRLETNDVVSAVLAINDYTDNPYDGVVFRNITDSASLSAENINSDIIALFDSNQFKLIGNESPTDSPDIRLSLGADNSDIQEGLDANAEAVEQNGAYDYGRNPTRNLDIAKRTDAGPTSRFWNNLANSEYVSDEEAQKIQARIGKGLGTYEQTTNKEQRTKARQMIRKEGLENSLRYMLEGNTNTATDIMFGKELLSEMTEKGLTGSDEYYQLQENLAYRATMAGQALQAYNTFRTQTPQGQIITITSEMERIQQALNERFGEGTYDVQLNEGLIEEYLRATTQEERDNIRLKLAVDIAEQIPPTLMEQLNSWRHVSMLFNPRTWIKNASANFVHGYINEITRAMRSVAEGVAQKIDPNIQRQAGTYNPFSSQDKANYEKAIKDYNENFTGNISKYNNYDIFGGLTSTDFGRQVMDNRKQFTWNFLNNISDLNARMMSDRPAVSKAYAKTLVGYLKVNNLTFETITSEQMRQAREFAMKEALYATFNSDNWLANQITRLEREADKLDTRVGAMTRMIVESFVPFKRTPFNILKTGFNYSPVGLAKTLSLNLLDLKNNKITANTFIDNLCQGLTGSGIMLLGALLSNLGIFRTKDKDEDRKKYFDQDNGEQDYSINFGNRSYTIDWLDPLIIPLSMGAEMQKLMADGRLSLNDLSALATAMMEPLLETSMMSGITKNLKSYANDSTGYTTDIFGNAMKNYASQYIPSIMGALARTVDDTRRSTYTSKEEESVFNNEFIKKIKNKIPGLSMTNEPYVNKQGQEQKNEDLGIGMVGRAVLNFLSPGYYAEKELDKYDEELYRLYEDTGELDALPSNNTKDITFEKENYKLSAKEYTAWHKTRWQTEAKYVNEFIDSKAYQNLRDEERVKTIKDIRSYAQKVAKKEFLNSRGIEFEGDKQLRQAQGAMNNGIDLYSYFDYLNNAGTKQAEKVKYLEESDLTKKQKEYLWDMNDYKKSYEDVYKKVFSETGDDSSSKKKSSDGSKNESSGNTSRVSGSGVSKKSTGRTSKGKSTKAKSIKTSDATVSKSTNIANKFLNAYSSTLKNVKESSNASTTTQSVKVCPKCGNRFHSSSGICPICGTKV